MTGFWHGKLKRKDLEDVYDDFAEFSLSSPARKIRRLDAELPPIMEEGEPTSTLVYNHQLPQGNISSSDMQTSGSVVSEAMSGYPLDNEERAIVLYKPVETPLILSPGPDNVSLRVSLDFIDGIRHHIFNPGNRSFDKKDQQTGVSNSCLAVIPWVPPHAATATSGFGGSESESKLSQEPMEAEETEAASMEVEEVTEQATTYGLDGEGFQQRQQHCLNPQHLPGASSPIMWSL
ncbi:hypothetical protein C4D60_Mb03t05190 [Musa balbisiana]|uniref:Uncharacterized protein n=1 Tax=Musa balbisiana TaxID=52838 RepID=A0A4S8J7N6_MUSBA|nr:hypothetical protein C4D60_Mb03t05190 [Musa balbisiana]